ncbi:MAG: NEW3 domain-containing protein [Candidatus Caldatribacteriota bacterium]|jgi:uncharacterized membrane protein|nr:NEW3 domain-containing protein [Atribacterota bacterium]MDD3031058.1 NEW3 domain-containing protein [Atribacterota bacterium]MDD3641406.1 NEW3 domain-containing protein [Atribacterota bacterium]MDD4289359.1 NEW3 domain-containing protein [Atribacterota bacterium]MDD5635314.1 NEW3 domain-containing protein [Atribacterota bacterium]
MNKKIKGFVFFILLIITLFSMNFFFCSAQISGNKTEERDFVVYSEFSDLILEEDTSTDIEVKIINTGDQHENIRINLIPDADAKNWNVVLRNKSYRGYEVRQVNLLSKDPDNSKTLNLHIEVPEKIETKKDEYVFTIEAETIDGQINKTLDLVLNVTEKTEDEIEEETNEILLNTKYPSVESPSGNAMKFEIEVKNETEEDQVMDFAVDIPQGWRASISPRWREEEKISAIKINKGASETILLTVTPPFTAEKNEYILKFIAQAGELQKSLDLTAKVTGTYTLKLGTETGNLKLSAVAGEEKEYYFYIWNEGSASIDNISFVSSVPEGWDVKFNPDKIEELPSLAQTQKPEKVTMTISVPQNTLPGDYMITVNASGTQDIKKIDFRTTVNVPTKWGWIGVAIIIAILAILFGIFVKLRRR